MMLPFFRRRPAPKLFVLKQQAIKPVGPSLKTTEVQLKHLDYDLQPLDVEKLSHYIKPTSEEERFRVH